VNLVPYNSGRGIHRGPNGALDRTPRKINAL
jgi:hypothetical protein